MTLRLLPPLLVLGSAVFASLSCQQLHESATPVATTAAVAAPPPHVPSFEERLEGALRDGHEVDEVSAELKTQSRCPLAVRTIAQDLSRPDPRSPESLQRAMSLYLLCPDEEAPKVFEALAASRSGAARGTAWRLATSRPSPGMAQRVGRTLSSALAKDDLGGLATPAVAEAVRANKVPGSYPFLQQALAVSGSGAFLKTMIAVDPEHASDDAVTYLAKATAEDLRASSPTSVDVAACKVILGHLQQHPPSLSHPNVGHLFLYANARDKELSAGAGAALASMATTNAAALASVFTKMARKAQIAYVETLRTETALALAVLRREIRARVTDGDVIAAMER